MPSLRWQYFASETGITTVYPGLKVTDCTSYDGRFRLVAQKTEIPQPNTGTISKRLANQQITEMVIIMFTIFYKILHMTTLPELDV